MLNHLEILVLYNHLHLLEKWAWQAVTDRRVVDPVVSVLGENVLLWSMNWFIKEYLGVARNYLNILFKIIYFLNLY